MQIIEQTAINIINQLESNTMDVMMTLTAISGLIFFALMSAFIENKYSFKKPQRAVPVVLIIFSIFVTSAIMTYEIKSHVEKTKTQEHICKMEKEYSGIKFEKEVAVIYERVKYEKDVYAEMIKPVAVKTGSTCLKESKII